MKIISKFMIAAMFATSIVPLGGVVYSSKAEAATKRERALCRKEARRIARRATQGSVVTDTVVGAGLGTLGGAIIGGHHSKRKGAVIGAGLGLVTSAATRDARYQARYEEAYDDCIADYE